MFSTTTLIVSRGYSFSRLTVRTRLVCWKTCGGSKRPLSICLETSGLLRLASAFTKDSSAAAQPASKLVVLIAIIWVGEFLRIEASSRELSSLVEAWPLALGPPSPDSPRHPTATSSRSHPTLYHNLTQYNSISAIALSGGHHLDTRLSQHRALVRAASIGSFVFSRQH
jgi:hypothetical protein